MVARYSQTDELLRTEILLRRPICRQRRIPFIRGGSSHREALRREAERDRIGGVAVVLNLDLWEEL